MSEREQLGESILLTVSPEEAGERLDVLLSRSLDKTRSAVTRWIEESCVCVNQRKEPKNYRLRAEDRIEIWLPQPTPTEAQPQPIPLDIVYEDEDLVVVNKPVGMVVHPAPGNPDGTLVNALLFHCGSSLSGVGGVIRPGIVHRIDKDTSGLLVVAKNDATHLALAEALKRHDVRRVYTAIAIGNLRQEQGTVDAPIGRHPVDRKRMAVLRTTDHTAREAVTHWSVLARGEAEGQCFTLLRCVLETGRTHQIRVHMASLGHPLLGDPVYGGTGTRFEARHSSLVQGQCLHAGELQLVHPRTGESMRFFAPRPKPLQKTVEMIFGAELAE